MESWTIGEVTQFVRGVLSIDVLPPLVGLADGKCFAGYSEAAFVELFGPAKGHFLWNAKEQQLLQTFAGWNATEKARRLASITRTFWAFMDRDLPAHTATPNTAPLALLENGPEVDDFKAILQQNQNVRILNASVVVLAGRISEYYHETMNAPKNCLRQKPEESFRNLVSKCFKFVPTVEDRADIVSEGVVVELKVAARFQENFISQTIVHVARRYLKGMSKCDRAAVFRQTPGSVEWAADGIGKFEVTFLRVTMNGRELPKVLAVKPPMFKIFTEGKVNRGEVRRMANYFLNFFGSEETFVGHYENVEDQPEGEEESIVLVESSDK